MSTQKNLNDCCRNNVCPICGNTGWATKIIDGMEYARECKCGIRQREIQKNMISFADIPDAFKDMRLDTFRIDIYKSDISRNKAENSIKGIKYWLSDFKAMNERGMGLYLYSNIKGSGKTRMAASIANELIEKKIHVKFSTSLQILEEIKNSWNNNEEHELLKQLSTSEVLVIDDFGTEQVKEWICERFYQIINERYINHRVTIFTSNYKLDTLDYDERIKNRLKEVTFQIPFPEESVREQIAKDNMQELVKGIKNN